MNPVVASVPYLNAKPIIYQLAQDDSVDLLFDVPSKLPAMVNAGEAAVAMASSFDAIRTPGRKVVEGVTISTIHQVESVRIFSKVPFSEIQVLALDQSSLTSNHLALILLSELHGIRPKTVQALPDIDAMLGEFDACVLIGDKGLTSEHPYARIMDMGLAWRELTGLPFVWALWFGGPLLERNLADKLRQAKVWGTRHLDTVIPWAAETTGIKLETCRSYLSKTMNYDMDEAHLAGLGSYAEYLKKHGFVPNPEPIQLV